MGRIYGLGTPVAKLARGMHLAAIPMDSKSTFIKRFGDLVALLRADPGNDAAQELALSAAAAAVADAPLRIEAGVQWHTIPEDMSLKARMLARQVEAFSVAAGTPRAGTAIARARTGPRPDPHSDARRTSKSSWCACSRVRWNRRTAGAVVRLAARPGDCPRRPGSTAGSGRSGAGVTIDAAPPGPAGPALSVGTGEIAG